MVPAAEDVGRDDCNTIFVSKGSLPVTVEWENEKKILVYFPNMSQEGIYKQQVKMGEILIEYNETIELANQTEYVEYSNFNFGLTGIAAGVHEEVLLRMAGWHQEKAGLIRKEWGNWLGDPPYGDDPDEHDLIKQGILFYRENQDEIVSGE